jgi:hypothetical protein
MIATIAKHAAPLALVVILAGCVAVEPEVRRPTARIVPMKIASQPLGAVRIPRYVHWYSATQQHRPQL